MTASTRAFPARTRSTTARSTMPPGIATLLEAARALAASPNRPRRSILFAAVTAEEDGLLGAQYLARNPLPGAQGRRGRQSRHADPHLRFRGRHRLRRRAFDARPDRRARRRPRWTSPSRPIRYPEEGLFTRSDHYEFVKVGIPSVSLATGFEGAGQEKPTPPSSPTIITGSATRWTCRSAGTPPPSSPGSTI